MNTIKNERSEFVYQVAALALAFIVVHIVYVGVVRPNADAVMKERAELMATDTNYVEERSVWIVIKDYEQESCFVLMLWAFAIMGLKATRARSEQSLLDRGLINISEGTKVLPVDARKLARPIEQLDSSQQKYLLPRAILRGLQRFGSGGTIQEVSNSVQEVCDNESQRLDSELAMVRYIAWAIPSIGFIGTVRGIGTALANAQEAVNGDIAGVTASLGVAFNSTFIALLISIVIMFLSHQLTLIQERSVMESREYLDRELLQYMETN